MMWPGVEPKRGEYNQTYIDAAKDIVNKCVNSRLIHMVAGNSISCFKYRAGQKYGIYTLLDMHQDVLSGKFCGEGIPDWAVETGSERAKKIRRKTWNCNFFLCVKVLVDSLGLWGLLLKWILSPGILVKR